MSSAKSRNFRRRAGDDDDDDSNMSTKTNGTVSNTAKPKKPTATSQPRAKTLLSFADDEFDEGEQTPFSRPAVTKPSSSSISSIRSSSQKSAHKLTSSKDRNAPKPPSSSLPSNVQPQSGMYTKEALLELQKNTKTLAARSKPKPPSEPVVVLKGLIKPVAEEGLDDGRVMHSRDVDGGDLGSDKKAETSTLSREETELTKLKNVRLGVGLREDKEGIPDQATIEAIRAKRERLRQVRAAAPDYIALDSGGNHGENEGLSDEEPEFRGRIGFFGEKIGDKRGVFEEFDAMVVSKEKDVITASEEDNDEDEEDKMWEEEQVRKGLGKRLDEGVTSQGVSVSVSSVGHASSLLPVYGYSNVGVNGVYASMQSGNIGHGSAGGDIFSSDTISITQQAELAKKALQENMKRTKESLSRTDASLAKTEDNLLSSLASVTRLENSLAAAGEKFLFMQKLRDYISVICEFLRHKAPFIEELEDQMQNLHKERARTIAERRQVDNEDEISEIEKAIIAARAELRKGGNDVIKLATAAAQAAVSNAKTLKNAPVELDEFGRDLNLQKRTDIARRAKARERKSAKADAKRRLAMENDASFQQMEGEMSTDESDSESTAYESTRNELLHVADKIFSDAEDEYSQFAVVIERFEKWKKEYASSYRDAYMSLSIASIFSPYVRLELLKWDPLHKDADFMDMKWHSLLFNYGLSVDENTNNGEDADDDDDANLIPQLVEKLAIPILQYQLASCWNMLSTRETRYAVSAMNLIIRYVNLSSSALAELITILRDRLTKAVSDLTIPTWSPLEMKAVPNASKIAAYKFGTSVRLLRNICLWDKILATPVLEKIVVDQLLCGKILPHLLSIQSNIHEAVLRTERVIASLNGVWSGPGVTGDQSRKLQPLVDYLLLLGKKLEKMQISSSMDTETGKLVRRLKKMLVELNEYDHGRAISRTFNLKEAL